MDIRKVNGGGGGGAGENKKKRYMHGQVTKIKIHSKKR